MFTCHVPGCCFIGSSEAVFERACVSCPFRGEFFFWVSDTMAGNEVQFFLCTAGSNGESFRWNNCDDPKSPRGSTAPGVAFGSLQLLGALGSGPEPQDASPCRFYLISLNFAAGSTLPMSKWFSNDCTLMLIIFQFLFLIYPRISWCSGPPNIFAYACHVLFVCNSEVSHIYIDLNFLW